MVKKNVIVFRGKEPIFIASSNKKGNFMTIIKTLLAGLFVVSVCIAQIAVGISGKVTDSTGITPIAGATVQLEKGGLPTTSGADGSFTITGTVGIITPSFQQAAIQ